MVQYIPESEVQMVRKIYTDEERKKARQETRHAAYLKARELNKSYVNTRKKKEISDEEREKRRIRSAEWRTKNPNRSREYMLKWRMENPDEKQRTIEFRRNNKKLAIEYLGGKCIKCNGVFHPDVYDFHHKDEKEKDICVAKLLGRKFEGIKEELDKCILVCANCHRVIHAQY